MATRAQRNAFIEEFMNQLNEEKIVLSEEAMVYFNEIKASVEKANEAKITEKGMKVLEFMKENREQYNNLFSAKAIGEGLFTSGRSVSGTLTKLKNDGWVKSSGSEPVTYSLVDFD